MFARRFRGVQPVRTRATCSSTRHVVDRTRSNISAQGRGANQEWRSSQMANRQQSFSGSASGARAGMVAARLIKRQLRRNTAHLLSIPPGPKSTTPSELVAAFKKVVDIVYAPE